ncbi:molecular chaperone [Niveomyces insectorum RCEF 264]|uniref:Molecular chaperone n=1 Tax=Niveomyces insectorum RCEF 264 TaxID=1081102 RepID=A0A167X6S8_9HYPO|nr:molecular chaperone [Niveomyces insectorum RCEF 264]
MAESTGSNSTALVRKRTDTELMPPPPPAKRIQRPKMVLDEDTYTDGLSKIIARDFFPGLLESESQLDYLNALDSKDEAWISSAGRRLREVMTPGRRRRSRLLTPSSLRSLGHDGASVFGGKTPRSFAGDTPASVVSVGTEVSTSSTTVSTAATRSSGMDKKPPDTNVSLGAFQAKYTSEDNESFYKLLDRQNQTRAEKHAWLWNGNKLPSKMQLKQKEVKDRLLLAAGGTQATDGSGTLVDDGFQKRDRLAIQDRDGRPAAPDSWKFTTKSALMFHPDGVDDAVETVAQKAQAEARAPPKSIVYENTRLPGTTLLNQQSQQASSSSSSSAPPDQRRRRDTLTGASVPPSPTLSAVRDAIAGKPRRVDEDSAAGSTLYGGETPRVNGYAFVDDEEEPPTAAGTTEPEPVIEFGNVDGTPNPFQLQAQSKREGLHHRMVERIAQSKRTSARVGLTGRADATPPAPYMQSPRSVGNLTPAGQRLWSKVGGAQRRDAIAAFNGHRSEQQRYLNKGSRRARLKEIRSAYR